MKNIEYTLNKFYEICKEVFDKIYLVGKKWSTSKGAFAILSIITTFTIIIVPIVIDIDYSNTLKEFATINITIAIGIIAAIIAMNRNNIEKDDIWIRLIQMLIGVLSYFFWLLNNNLVSRVYLILNGISIITTITVTGGIIVEAIKEKTNK